MAKNKPTGGFVYSTDPTFRLQEDDFAVETPDKKQQKLRLRLEKRNGKPTTVIAGFIGKDEDLQALGKLLKTKAGTGGSAKDGEIIIQGDCREKAVGWLKEWGYANVK